MTYDFDDLAFSPRYPAPRRLVERQRQQLKEFDGLDTAMENLWKHCESVRSLSLRERRRSLVDGDKLQQIADACETGFLELIPSEDRFRMSKNATAQTNDYLASWFDSLGDLGFIAHLEIGLRVLIHLVVRATRDMYEPEMRLPAWEHAIAVAESKLETTVDAWRSLPKRSAASVNAHED